MHFSEILVLRVEKGVPGLLGICAVMRWGICSGTLVACLHAAHMLECILRALYGLLDATRVGRRFVLWCWFAMAARAGVLDGLRTPCAVLLL